MQECRARGHVYAGILRWNVSIVQLSAAEDNKNKTILRLLVDLYIPQSTGTSRDGDG